MSVRAAVLGMLFAALAGSGDAGMNPKIVEQGAFTVAGIAVRTSLLV